MYKHEMDPTRTVVATERTQDAGGRDVFKYEQTHNMMQVWTGKLIELQLPVQNPARERALAQVCPDGQTDGRTGWNQYTPPTTSLCGGYVPLYFLSYQSNHNMS